MRWSVVVAAFGVGLAASAGAMAAGGPVPPVQGNEGIGIAGSPVRFVVTPAEGDTLVRRVTAGLRRSAVSSPSPMARRRFHGASS